MCGVEVMCGLAGNSSWGERRWWTSWAKADPRSAPPSSERVLRLVTTQGPAQPEALSDGSIAPGLHSPANVDDPSTLRSSTCIAQLDSHSPTSFDSIPDGLPSPVT